MRPYTKGRGERLAQGLGWLGVGLGLAQLAVPGRLTRMIGLASRRRNRNTLRAIGATTAALGVVVVGAMGRRLRAAGRAASTKRSVTVLLPLEEVQAAWRNRSESLRRVADDKVRFVPAPGGRGTEVHVELAEGPPAHEVERDLRRFKQVLEAGEVIFSDASIHREPHPARPPSRTTVRPHGGRRV